MRGDLAEERDKNVDFYYPARPTVQVLKVGLGR
jgi:hypothetical protein